MRTVLFTAALALGVALCAPGLTSAGAGEPDPPRFEVIVEPSLYAAGQLDASLARYVSDIAAQGYAPTLTTTAFADANALRTHLADRYATAGLAGAVLIGDLPYATYQIPAHGVWSGSPFPSDLYLQDLDGVWTDADDNGHFENHTGDVAPEIFVGRLQTSNLTGLHGGRTEAGMLNAYFSRNRRYRTGHFRVPDDALAYIDDTWDAYGYWANDLHLAVEGGLEKVIVAGQTTESDYKSRLQKGFEHVLLCVHSTATRHDFDEPGGLKYMYNTELAGVDANALFYNLFACSNADFSVNGYMAGEYVFGTDKSLLAVGTTKTGSMLEFDDYFRPLGEGATFGEAWLDWWTARAAGGFSNYEKDWHYGMAMLGDPLLRTQAYLPIPEPATVGLLAACGVFLLRRRRTSRPRSMDVSQ